VEKGIGRVDERRETLPVLEDRFWAAGEVKKGEELGEGEGEGT
jgi:hypothetical protein